MAGKSKKEAEVHYLDEISQPVRKYTQGLDGLLRGLGKKLSGLEKALLDNLEKIQGEVFKKSGPSPSVDPKVQKEIAELKKEFHQQIEDIRKTLKKEFKSKLKEKNASEPGLIERVKSWLPDLSGLFSNDQAEKHFQALYEEEFDPFGRDPAFEQKVKPLFDFLYHKYWRISAHGLENVPSDGRALIVANHSGTLAYDGTMVRMAVSVDHPSQRDVRFLVEDFVYYLPFIGSFMYRVGGVRASRDNAERLLNSGHLVAVFPEGVKGIGKYYSQRYHLQRFGRGGFIKLAIRTKSPIIPVAIIGAEEIHPLLYKSSLLAKPLGIPYVPITPTLPLLGPLGLLPLPSKWSIYFGKPIDMSRYGPATLKDELKIHKLSEMVRQNIQDMVTEGLKKRRSIWFG